MSSSGTRCPAATRTARRADARVKIIDERQRSFEKNSLSQAAGCEIRLPEQRVAGNSLIYLPD
jgi:hypothetical protein